MSDTGQTDLDAAAEAVLRGNDRGGYTVPTAGLYPFQWNWDSCLSALGIARYDPARAWAELDSLFSAQWSDGMQPHIVFHREDPGYFPGPERWATGRTPPTSGITQPPVAAFVVRRLVEQASDPALARERATALLPKLLAWHRWFRGARDPDRTGLVAILHPWESGRDNSPEWDAALKRVPTGDVEPYRRRDTEHVDPSQRPSKDDYDRYMALVQAFRDAAYDPALLYGLSPFRVADIGVNAILARSDHDLAWLCDRLGDDAGADWARWAAVRTETALEQLWNPQTGAFHSLDLVTGELVPPVTSGAFLGFLADTLPGEAAAALPVTLDAWLAKAPHGVASIEPGSPLFEARRYWRGPSWPVVNFLIAAGLTRHGHHRQAGIIAAMTRDAIARNGFCEYVDPLTGDGLGGRQFSWTAAVWLAWFSPRCQTG